MAASVLATCYLEDEFAPLRLLVLPHAGGSAKALALDWSKSLRDAGVGVEVWGVDWSWADDGAACSSAQWLAAVRAQLSARFFDKPFVVAGHSLGALAAVAFVDHLQAQGFALPLHVFVSGAAGPAHWTLFDDAAVLQRDDALLELLRQWGGTDAELLAAPAQREPLLRQLRADLALHNALVQGVQSAAAPLALQTSLSVFGGESDASVPVATLAAWQAAVTAPHSVEVQTFTGDHFFLSSAASQRAVASALVARLQAVSARNALESRALIAQWNAKAAPYPADQCLHELFAAAVLRSPDAVAVYDEGRALTFAEVDEQSERLADYLFQVGVRRNRISGIFMEHCAEFVVAYVAALKAGGAYMPLEVVYPPELLARVLEESQPTIVLTKRAFRHRLPAWQEALELNADWREALAARSVPPMPADRERTRPDDLAYVVMSSGTTGVPKGICCPHRGAVHSYDWRLVNCPYAPDDRVASHVFFVWELLRPLLGNVPLYVIPDDTIYDPVRLVAYLAQHAITRVLFTPSLLQLVLDTCPGDELQRALGALRLVWLCGEVVTIELRDRFVRLFPACELQNLYSVSECHDVSAVDLAHLSAFDSALSAKYASCGAVMPNVRAFVLDDAFAPVSIGVPGELYIGGPCLALGYLNRPEQTAQRFLDHVVPGERVYKTGDRARFLPNGHLELIGRCDFMVKIRGYSVVLGAVESALAQHPLVSTAVVLTEGDEGQDKRLVAYIVPDKWDQVPSAASLRAFLKEKLPHYAIPSVFVQLDALPINSASGKLDRKRMPTADQARKLRSASIDVSGDSASAPQTPTESRLAAIWAELLRLESDKALSRHASFFDVGGHSLLATRLISSVRDALNVQLTLADILAAPELSAVAARIDAARAHPAGSGSGSATVSATATPAGATVVLPLEALLDAAIYPAATRKAGYSRYRVEMVGRPPRSVLLTGATGFLGAHLLHALLRDTETTVYCLVRAASEELALARVRQSLAAFALGDELERLHVEERVVAVPGDLGKPLLGVGEDTFKMLAAEVDAIVHNGAEVNLVKPYAALKSANVLGTQEVLRLAVTNGLAKTRVKPVHYVSTNGVFPAGNGSNRDDSDDSNNDALLETADLRDVSERLENGYAQSKWVAEQMCLEAAARGLPVSVLRPGNMAPAAATGAWNPRDFVYLLLRGCWALGALPPRADWRFDLTPVDFAARAIVHLAALHPVTALGQTLHIQNPARATPGDAFFALLEAAAAARGKQLARAASYDEWKQRLAAHVDASEELQLLAAGLDAFDGYLTNPKAFDSARATELLRAAGITCPPVDAALVATYVADW
ncbi:hypothetical protein PybrP1_002293 [[Pythium] brassicae (nom. inval.)]|nr:hypothetical protein PybrP1_002293 [[Pythium] brassicae (nom. inval.)]